MFIGHKSIIYLYQFKSLNHNFYCRLSQIAAEKEQTKWIKIRHIQSSNLKFKVLFLVGRGVLNLTFLKCMTMHCLFLFRKVEKFYWIMFNYFTFHKFTSMFYFYWKNLKHLKYIWIFTIKMFFYPFIYKFYFWTNP